MRQNQPDKARRFFRALLLQMFHPLAMAGVADHSDYRRDPFGRLVAVGIIVMFAGQAFINILVNLQLFPSKGMTLPLISYGGSSTIAQCMLVGLLLAFTRRNPFLTREGVGITAALPQGRRAKP